MSYVKNTVNKFTWVFVGMMFFIGCSNKEENDKRVQAMIDGEVEAS